MTDNRNDTNERADLRETLKAFAKQLHEQNLQLQKEVEGQLPELLFHSGVAWSGEDIGGTFW